MTKRSCPGEWGNFFFTDLSRSLVPKLCLGTHSTGEGKQEAELRHVPLPNGLSRGSGRVWEQMLLYPLSS